MKILRRDLTTPTAAVFFRQVAAMVAAGVPVKEALAAVAEDDTSTTTLALGYAGDGLTKKGRTDFFKRVFAYLEKNSRPNKAVARSLYQVAEEIDKYREFKVALSQIFFMPFMTLLLAGLLLALMLIFVIPVWQELFDTMQGQLPAPTQTIIDLSGMIGSYAYIILPAIFIAGGLLVANRNALINLLSAMPVFRRLSIHQSMVRFARYLSVLLHIDLPLGDAVAIAAQEVRCRPHARKLQQAAAGISASAPLSRQLKKTGLITSVVGRMIDVGETSGTLAMTLNDISVLYEKEADIALAEAVYWSDIVIKFMVGAIIGALVISMYLPIFKLGGAMI